MDKNKLAKGAVTIATTVALVFGGAAIGACACSNQQQSTSSASQKEATPTSFTVPNVVSLSQSDAEKAIHASGLQLGEVKVEASDSVPTGNVISQNPKALTNVDPNSKVNLVVSSGKAAPKEVTVPDLKGKSQADAEQALKDVGLVGVKADPEETTEVAPGQVFRQSLAAGTKTKEGARVTFTVALAPAESTVPNVIGMNREDARNAIIKANLGYDSTTAYDDNVAEGKVISQTIAAGTKVRQGSTVTINVSLGKKPAEDVTVPDVLTYTWDDAQAAMRSAGLAVRYTGDPTGVVVAQDIVAGSKVAPNTLVTVTLEAKKPDVGELFLGSWQADRPTMQIQNIGGGFFVTIDWAQGSDDHYRWEYVCDLQDNKLVCNGAGRKYHTTADGETATEYEDGSASFSLDENGRLTWNDQKESAGQNLLFSKID